MTPDDVFIYQLAAAGNLFVGIVALQEGSPRSQTLGAFAFALALFAALRVLA